MAPYSSLYDVPSAHLEDVGCGLCGEMKSGILFRIKGFPIRQCVRCGMRYVSPRLRPSSLLQMYSEPSYFQSPNSLVHGYMDYAADRDNILNTAEKRFRWISSQWKSIKPGRLLDIGCAMGYSLEYAMDQEWEAWGLEPSRHAAQASSPRLAGRIANTNLEACPYDRGSFDLILLWDVVEHLPDPARLLRQVLDLVRPGGMLSLITPDAGSFLARFAGRWWMEYAKPMEHIYFFSRKTLRRLTREVGFIDIAETTAGKFVSREFLLERFLAHLPIPAALRNSGISKAFLSRCHYVDVADKMHVLLQRPG